MQLIGTSNYFRSTLDNDVVVPPISISVILDPKTTAFSVNSVSTTDIVHPPKTAQQYATTSDDNQYTVTFVSRDVLLPSDLQFYSLFTFEQDPAEMTELQMLTEASRIMAYTGQAAVGEYTEISWGLNMVNSPSYTANMVMAGVDTGGSGVLTPTIPKANWPASDLVLYSKMGTTVTGSIGSNTNSFITNVAGLPAIPAVTLANRKHPRYADAYVGVNTGAFNIGYRNDPSFCNKHNVRLNLDAAQDVDFLVCKFYRSAGSGTERLGVQITYLVDGVWTVAGTVYLNFVNTPMYIIRLPERINAKEFNLRLRMTRGANVGALRCALAVCVPGKFAETPYAVLFNDLTKDRIDVEYIGDPYSPKITGRILE